MTLSTENVFSIEEVFDELLNLGDSSGSTDEHDLIDFTLLHAGIIKYLLDRLNGLLEERTAKFLEFGTSDSLLEVNAISNTFNANLYLMD